MCLPVSSRKYSTKKLFSILCKLFQGGEGVKEKEIKEERRRPGVGEAGDCRSWGPGGTGEGRGQWSKQAASCSNWLSQYFNLKNPSSLDMTFQQVLCLWLSLTCSQNYYFIFLIDTKIFSYWCFLLQYLKDSLRKREKNKISHFKKHLLLGTLNIMAVVKQSTFPNSLNSLKIMHPSNFYKRVKN